MGVEKVSAQAVILLREEHPEFTLREIGEKAHERGGWGKPITRERSRQVLVKAGKPTKSRDFPYSKRAHCHLCGSSSKEKPLRWTMYKGKSMPRCADCMEKVKQERWETKNCPYCYHPFTSEKWRKKRFCSMPCEKKFLAGEKTVSALDRHLKSLEEQSKVLTRTLKALRTLTRHAVRKLRAQIQ